MSKSKGIVLGSIEGATRHVDAGPGSGHGLSHTDIGMVRDPKYSQPPARSSHVPQQEAREETFHAGAADTPAGMNTIDGKRGTMGLDEKRNAPAKDSPVSTKGRQMPNRDDTAKAAAVKRELAKPEAEGPPRGGTMDDR